MSISSPRTNRRCERQHQCQMQYSGDSPCPRLFELGTQSVCPKSSKTKPHKGDHFLLPTQDANPIKEEMRCYSSKVHQVILQHVMQMNENDIIEPTRSPWVLPLVLAKKKDGTWHFLLIIVASTP